MSSNDIAISVRGLSKSYTITHDQEKHITLAETILSRLKNPLRRPKTETFWALKDVSFDIKRGDVVGIIGRNGAGKSTLLKVLSRITQPSAGEVDIYGRVGSLLEVGTGFHPELTGRENIYLNGAILGMGKAEIKRQFDAIVDFAGVEKFLDTPVKRYSSGMYVRLAFAVAAHLNPEILIVDEVLAVGDAQFQKKCLGKMGDVAKEGRTVLFVSHNMPAVRNLCGQVVWLDLGEVRRLGVTSSVISEYMSAGGAATSLIEWNDVATAPGTYRGKVHAIRFLTIAGDLAERLDIDQPLIIEVDYWALEAPVVLNVSVSLFTEDDTYVFAAPSISDTKWYQRPHPPGLYRSRCVIPASLLNTGRYMATAILVENGSVVLAQVDRAVSIEMVDPGTGRGTFFGHWGGVVRPHLAWVTTRLCSVPAGA